MHARLILDVAGLGADAIESQRLNFNETADALRNGDIAAGFWSVAAPNASILNLASQRSIRLVELNEAEFEASLAASPVFHRSVVAAGTYPGVEQDVPVLAVPNMLVTSGDMPEELAYAITRALFENHERLSAIHPAVKQMTGQYTLESSPIPLHPGAVRYLEERGEVIPPELRP